MLEPNQMSCEENCEVPTVCSCQISGLRLEVYRIVSYFQLEALANVVLMFEELRLIAGVIESVLATMVESGL
ncbi:hypothetical protein HHK36_005751 [Tetracentron sinense]|uniref:Uncharacterized protein n=1 Tax=Tetracentron sinense TaxID=13715 RepID=A0A834ZVX8_TETSI|nr:hypothetical protein HHK36_005751 [Tetracentron sinense]